MLRSGSADVCPTKLEMPPLYLTAQCLNTYNWVLFGIQTRQKPVVYPNVVGITLGVLYTMAYPLLVDESSWDPAKHGNSFRGAGMGSAPPSSPQLHDQSSLNREVQECRDPQSFSTMEAKTPEECRGEVAYAGGGRHSSAEPLARNIPFRRNFRLQYYLQLLLIAVVWAAPWVFKLSTTTIGWIAVLFDSLFVSAPLFVFYEVVLLEWRNKANVVLLGSWAMDLAGLLSCLAWFLEYLMYIPLPQLLPGNVAGLVIEGAAVLVRVLKWMM